MLRTILAIFVGLLAAMALIFGVEVLGMLFSPPSTVPLPQTEADLARMVAEASPLKKSLVVFGWALASLVGGWVAARIAPHPRFAAAAIGALIVTGCVMNALSIPHPLWMNALGVLLPIPLAVLGERLARAKPQDVATR